MPRGAARVLIALTCLAAACDGAGEVPRVDSERARLLGALPDDALSRGVYAFDGHLTEERSPGSLLAPIIGSLIAQADLVVETGAPPVTLLSGLEEGVDLPEQMILVDGVAVIGSDGDVAAAREAIESGGEGSEPLTLLAASPAPVGWVGPLPGCEPGVSSDLSEGSFLVEVSPDLVRVTVTGTRAGELENLVDQRLLEEGPPHSPGKPWRTILTDHRIQLERDRLVIEARPVDLPGGLLRLLLDTRAFSFLRPPDC